MRVQELSGRGMVCGRQMRSLKTYAIWPHRVKGPLPKHLQVVPFGTAARNTAHGRALVTISRRSWAGRAERPLDQQQVGPLRFGLGRQADARHVDALHVV